MVRKKRSLSKKKKENWFKESWRYIKESQKFVWSVVLIFLAGILFGVLLQGELGFIEEYFRELVEQIEGFGSRELIWFIFANNISSAFMGLFLGVFFGVFSVFSALSNGVVVGYVLSQVWPETGAYAILQLIPHGIFELPAIFISLGLGLRLGGFVFSEKPWETLRERFWKSLKVFVCVILPLLIVAAIIEGFLIALA